MNSSSSAIRSTMSALRQRVPARHVQRAVDLDALIESPDLQDAVERLTTELGRSRSSVLDELVVDLRELDASIDPAAMAVWHRFGERMMRAYDTVADETMLTKLRDLDRTNSLIFLPSHRSYLDFVAAPALLRERGIGESFALGGANLNFFPFGAIANRTGMIFIRRSTTGDPVYRLALRSYVGAMLESGCNFTWAIEGGRTRTGKLRPPRYGLLRYVIDAVEAHDGPEIYLVPTSIVYDQLHEVSLMTAEARGGAKSQENVRWLAQLFHQQRNRLGNVYVDFGEPIPLRERLRLEASATAESSEGAYEIERIALSVCHRINRATPVTEIAAVTLALLAGDRAMALDEIVTKIEPIAHYVQSRSWPTAGGGSLTDRNAIRRSLRELVESGVVSVYNEGIETVWTIASGQHLVGAFYRNTIVHVLLNRAIAELALLAASQRAATSPSIATVEEIETDALDVALELRELLKFEFFFAGRAEFLIELRNEMALIVPEWSDRTARLDGDHEPATQLIDGLAQARSHAAHLVLRPFFEAYLVVADVLASWSGDVDDERAFLDRCLGVGRQLVLQRRIASEESLTLELFRPAVRLAGHRKLMADTDVPGSSDALAKRRRAFAAEIRATVDLVHVIADMATDNAAEPEPPADHLLTDPIDAAGQQV